VYVTGEVTKAWALLFCEHDVLQAITSASGFTQLRGQENLCIAERRRKQVNILSTTMKLSAANDRRQYYTPARRYDRGAVRRAYENRLWIREIFPFCAAAWLCFAGVEGRQDARLRSADKPKACGKTYGPIGGEIRTRSDSGETLQPDERPPDGNSAATVGTPLERHSYWVPGVSYYNFIDSNGSSQEAGASWSSNNYIAGNVSLLENWSDRTGAELFRWRRFLDGFVGWKYDGFRSSARHRHLIWERCTDPHWYEFAYLPQSQFDLARHRLMSPGVGGTLGQPSTGLGGQFNPGQSIFTAIGPRYMKLLGH